MTTDFETELKKNGCIAFTNKGVSMMPLLRHDRDVMVIQAKSGPLKKNDAVLYRRPNGEYILHRITEVRGNGLYMIVGDNCVSGELVPEDRILGVLTEVVRDGKTISCTDPAYLRYVKSVPLRRFFFSRTRPVKRKAAWFVRKVRGRLKRLKK